MQQPLPLVRGKRFFCREWIFSKILHCLEDSENELADPPSCDMNRTLNGIMIIGGPGTGKTALCSEIVSPTSSHGKQLILKKRVLAYHFCQSNDSDSLSIPGFILHLVKHFCDSRLIQGYSEKVDDDKISKAIEVSSTDPDSAFRELILIPLLEISKPDHCYLLLIDSIDESDSSPPISNHPTSSKAKSTSIGELLTNNTDLLPPWLIPVYAARKHSKSSGYTSSFRRICLDDLRKPQVVISPIQILVHYIQFFFSYSISFYAAFFILLT